MEKNNKLRIAIPLIVLLSGLVFYQYGIVKVRNDVAELREREAIKLKTLGKYTNLISEKPSLEKRLLLLKDERKNDEAKLVDGQTISIAAGTLLDAVKGVITGKGGSISSERVGKAEDLGKFKVINISIESVLPDARALSDILYSIETRTPYLVVKELDSRVRNYREPRELMVKFDLEAITGAK